MRVAGITARGEPVEILEVDERAPPAPDEVLLDVAAAGIGNWDELVRIGSWQLGGPAPMALGTEAAGTVVAAGSGVAEVRDGNEVMTHPLPLRRHGTWGGKVLAPTATIAPRPRAASWEASGAFPIPALTAAQALDDHVEGRCRRRPHRHDHGRPAAGGTGCRRIRRLRPARRSAAVGPRGAAGLRHP